MAYNITPLSIAPSRDDPVNFDPRSDNFFDGLPLLRTEVAAGNAELAALSQQLITDANLVLGFRNFFFGTAAANPTTRPAVPPAAVGQPLQIGDVYYNTADRELKVFAGPLGWRGIGSFVLGLLDVQSYVRANYFVPDQFSFKNAPSANLVINMFSHFVIEVDGVTTQLSFAFLKETPGAADAVEFSVDLKTNGAFSVVFPGNVRWSNNTAPSFQSNRRHLLRFLTSDSGSTWLASAEVLNATATGFPVLT